MKKITTAMLILIVSIATHAVADEMCGDPPKPEFSKQQNEAIKADLEGKAKFLSGYVGNAELTGKIEGSRQEIFAKYPDADKARSNAYLLYMFCRVIFEPSNTQSTQDKIDALQAFRLR